MTDFDRELDLLLRAEGEHFVGELEAMLEDHPGKVELRPGEYKNITQPEGTWMTVCLLSGNATINICAAGHRPMEVGAPIAGLYHVSCVVYNNGDEMAYFSVSYT